jgi:hypothetical protein
MFLDNRHRVIAFEKLFLGTIDGTSVHPSEVVKAALKCNAAAVIFAHNKHSHRNRLTRQGRVGNVAGDIRKYARTGNMLHAFGGASISPLCQASPR